VRPKSSGGGGATLSSGFDARDSMPALRDARSSTVCSRPSGGSEPISSRRRQTCHDSWRTNEPDGMRRSAAPRIKSSNEMGPTATTPLVTNQRSLRRLLEGAAVSRDGSSEAKLLRDIESKSYLVG
jgi:hypothetical protein